MYNPLIIQSPVNMDLLDRKRYIGEINGALERAGFKLARGSDAVQGIFRHETGLEARVQYQYDRGASLTFVGQANPDHSEAYNLANQAMRGLKSKYSGEGMYL